MTYFYDTSIRRDAGNHTAYTVTPINDPDTGVPFVDTQAGVDKRMVGRGRCRLTPGTPWFSQLTPRLLSSVETII